MMNTTNWYFDDSCDGHSCNDILVNRNGQFNEAVSAITK